MLSQLAFHPISLSFISILVLTVWHHVHFFAEKMPSTGWIGKKALIITVDWEHICWFLVLVKRLYTTHTAGVRDTSFGCKFSSLNGG